MTNLYTYHDVMYGPLDLSDAEGYNGMIMRILSSKAMSRLKNIKQIGFANNFYVSADHSRFAHALGTLHIAKRLVKQVFKDADFVKKACEEASKIYGSEFSQNLLEQHVYLAALLQDLGELPQQQATKRFFFPTSKLRSSLSEKFRLNAEKLTTKNVFTLACLMKDQKIKEAFEKKINNQFLAYLISGVEYKSSITLQAVRQILDGDVDADRLDYVMRDSYYTIGATSGIDSVIKSLLGYDYEGPIFDSPEPILWFLKQRGMLYNSVYLSPAYRIRKIVTMSLLNSIRNDEAYAKSFFNDSFPMATTQWELSYEDFICFDDILFSRCIEKFKDKYYKGDDTNLIYMLKVLSSPQNNYLQQWITCGETPPASTSYVDEFPSYFFYDTYRDLYDYTTFSKIKIKSQSFERIGPSPLYLENIGGPIGTSLNNFAFRVPVERAISVFYPHDEKQNIQATLESIQAGKLVKTLYEHDPLKEDIFDTRNILGFYGPTYFISYAFEDIHHVLMLATYLYSKNVKYVILYDRGGEQGIMKYIEGYIQSSDKAIIFLTETYLSKATDPDSYVYKEIECFKKHPKIMKYFVTLEELKPSVKRRFSHLFDVEPDVTIKTIKPKNYRNPFLQIDEFLKRNMRSFSRCENTRTFKNAYLQKIKNILRLLLQRQG